MCRGEKDGGWVGGLGGKGWLVPAPQAPQLHEKSPYEDLAALPVPD